LSRPSESTTGSFLDLVPVENRPRLLEGRPHRRGDEVAPGHQGRDRLLEPLVPEAEVAVGQDSDQAPVVVCDRNAGDVVPRHQLECVSDGCVGRQRHRLDDHPRLGALDLVDLSDLVLDREVAVEDPEPALARERDRQPSLGDRVHRRREDRNLEGDLAGQERRRGDLVRQHSRLGRDEQDVVEGQPLARELAIELDEALDRLRRELNGQLARDGTNRA
jgi:hypothetical protein